jgi:hypothetical protein
VRHSVETLQHVAHTAGVHAQWSSLGKHMAQLTSHQIEIAECARFWLRPSLLRRLLRLRLP